MNATEKFWVRTVLAVIVIGAVGGLWGCPNYRVYEQNLVGKAELARAEQNRQIAVAQARAKAEAANFEAEADTMRAHGVARANQILGQSLTGTAGEQYLHYLWIEALKTDGHVIYVPTEAGLPILEAGKR
jgi:regulator of protease activity HflC (stomatin/prohibitin superfamily)